MNSFGNKIKLSISGGSHDESLGCVIYGLPRGARIDTELVNSLIMRRSAASGGPGATPRHEADIPHILSGAEEKDGCLVLDGSPLAVRFSNSSVRKSDYGHIARPSHADYVNFYKYGRVVSGGGASSGRITLPMTFAGGVAASILKTRGVGVVGHVLRIGGVSDEPFDPVEPELGTGADRSFPLVDTSKKELMLSEIVSAREAGDTLSCECECAITGVPVGTGEPVFGGIESELSAFLFSIPGLRGVEFGERRFLRGSQMNDEFQEGGRTVTNRSGGVNGGMANGMPIVFRAWFRPVPSIGIEQTGFDLDTGRPAPIKITGRHDTCILPRGLAAVEAAAYFCILDIMESCSER